MPEGHCFTFEMFGNHLKRRHFSVSFHILRTLLENRDKNSIFLVAFLQNQLKILLPAVSEYVLSNFSVSSWKLGLKLTEVWVRVKKKALLSETKR